jgi:hypothetical protein
MKEKTDKVDAILREYMIEIKSYGSEIFYDYFADPELSMELMIGPLEIDEGLTYDLALKIAEKYGLRLRRYDFSRGKWSEPREYKFVFSVTVPDDEKEIKSVVKKLLDASKELKEAKTHILKILGY